MIRRWMAYLLLLCAAAIFYLLLNEYLSFFVLLLVLFLPLLSGVLFLLSPRQAKVEIKTEEGCFQKDTPIPLSISVRFVSGWLPRRAKIRLAFSNETLGQRVEETIYLTADKKGQRLTHHLSSHYGGQISCYPIQIDLYDLLGLFRRKGKLVRQDTSFLISPTFWEMSGVESEGRKRKDGEHFSLTQSGDDPSEFFGIREYEAGDRLSRVHWKMSQKLGRTLVREGGQPIEEEILFLLDFWGIPSVLDSLLEVLSSLTTFLLENQIFCKVLWWDEKSKTMMKVESGENFSSFLEEILCTLHSQTQSGLWKNAMDLGNLENSQVIYLCSFFSAEDARTLESVFSGGRGHVIQVGEGELVPPQELLWPWSGVEVTHLERDLKKIRIFSEEGGSFHGI